MSTRVRPQPRHVGSDFAVVRLFAAWLQAHGRAAVGALGRLSRTRMASIMTTAVLGIALALPAAFLLLLQNVEGVTADWEGGTTISLFMGPDIAEADYRSLAAEFAPQMWYPPMLHWKTSGPALV